MASQKGKRGCLFFFRAPYPCCCCWAGEGWMLFLLLALPEVLWNRRPTTALSFIGALENQNFSPTFLEKPIHPKWDYSGNVGLILGPPLRFPGSLTHGSFPVELSISPESMQTADRESQVSLQGKQAAWDSTWLLSQPMCCSETCQLQGFFSSQWRNFLSEISGQLCSMLLLLLQMKKPKAQRASHREGAGPWETWHYGRSAVLAATTQPQIHFQNVRYSLQN